MFLDAGLHRNARGCGFTPRCPRWLGRDGGWPCASANSADTDSACLESPAKTSAQVASLRPSTGSREGLARGQNRRLRREATNIERLVSLAAWRTRLCDRFQKRALVIETSAQGSVWLAVIVTSGRFSVWSKQLTRLQLKADGIVVRNSTGATAWFASRQGMTTRVKQISRALQAAALLIGPFPFVS